MIKHNTVIPHSKPCLSPKDISAVTDVLSSGFVGKGEIVKNVNLKAAKYLNKDFSFFVNSGSSAIFLALKALNIKQQDEVIISVYSCPSLLNQIINIGAIPVIVDTKKDTFFIDVAEVKKKITLNTKAILFYHPFGYYDDAIIELKSTGIPIIEDITHSFGATCNGLIAGHIGNITVTSLGSTKFITSGTGGVLATSNKEYAERINVLLDYDYETYNYVDNPERYNLQLGDINASLFLTQLENIEYIISRRKLIASIYQTHIASSLIHPNFNEAVHFRFFIQLSDHNIGDIKNILGEKNIICHVGGGKIISQVLGTNDLFNNAVSLHRKILSIPIYAALTDDEVDYIYDNVSQLIK